ncbi:hypothetical protein Btru_067550 [Bulinus truncatus]|nr:hypothetical protein Btru_067550 [Bulinus truncatus]
MATDSIEWMLQGILTSLLSGVGFYIITRALEYAKKYCQRERQRAMFMGKYFDQEENFDWQAFNGMAPPGSNPFRADVCNRAQAMFAAYKKSSAFLCHNKHAEEDTDDDSTSYSNDRPRLWSKQNPDCSRNIPSLLRFRNHVFPADGRNAMRGQRVYKDPSCTSLSRIKLWSQSSREVIATGTDSASTHTDQTEEFSFKPAFLNRSHTGRTTPREHVGKGDTEHKVCHKRKHANLLLQTESELMTATYSSYESMRNKWQVTHIFSDTDSTDTERSLLSAKGQGSFFSSLASAIPRPKEAITFRSETTTLTKKQRIVNRIHAQDDVALVSGKRLGGDDDPTEASMSLPDRQYFQGWATWFAVTHLPLSRLFHSSTELSEMLKGTEVRQGTSVQQKLLENLDLDEERSPPDVLEKRMASGDKDYTACDSQTRLNESKKSIKVSKKSGTRHKKKSISPRHVVIRRHSPPKSPRKRSKGNHSPSPVAGEHKRRNGSNDKNDKEQSVSPYVNGAVLSLKPIAMHRQNSVVVAETDSPRLASSLNRAATISLNEKNRELSLSPVKEVFKTSRLRDSDAGHPSVTDGVRDAAYDDRVGSPVDRQTPRRTPDYVKGKASSTRYTQLTPRQHDRISRNDKSILCTPTRFEKATMCQPTLREKATAFTPETRNKATIASPKLKSPMWRSETVRRESLILEAENGDLVSSCSGVTVRAVVGSKFGKQKRLYSFKTKKQASLKTLAAKQVKNKRRIPEIHSEQKQLTKVNTLRASVNKEWPDKVVKNAKKSHPNNDYGQISTTDKPQNNLKRQKSKNSIEKNNKASRIKIKTALSSESGMGVRPMNSTEHDNSKTVTENSKKSTVSKETAQRKDQRMDDTTLSLSGYGDSLGLQKTAPDVPGGLKKTESQESPILSIHDYSVTVCQSRVQDTFGPIITYHPKSPVSQGTAQRPTPPHPDGHAKRKMSLEGMSVTWVKSPSPAQRMVAETSPRPTSAFGTSSLLQSGKKLSPAVQPGRTFPHASQPGRKFPPESQPGRKFPPASQPEKKLSRTGHTVQPDIRLSSRPGTGGKSALQLAVKNKPSITHSDKKLPRGQRPATGVSQFAPVQSPVAKSAKDKKSQTMSKPKKATTNEQVGVNGATGKEGGPNRVGVPKSKRQATKPPAKTDNISSQRGMVGRVATKSGGKSEAEATALSHKVGKTVAKAATKSDTPSQQEKKSVTGVRAGKTIGSEVKLLQSQKEISAQGDELLARESSDLKQSMASEASSPTRVRKFEVIQTVVTTKSPSATQTTLRSRESVLSRLAPIAEHQQPTTHASNDVIMTPTDSQQQAPVAFHNASPCFKVGSPPRAFRNSSPFGVGSTPASTSIDIDEQPEAAHHDLSAPDDSHRRMVILRKSALDDVVKQIQLLH